MPISSIHWERGGVHLGQVASPSQCNQETHRKTMHTHTHTQTYIKGNLEILVNLAVMFLNREEAGEPGGKSHMDRLNMQTPYTPNVTFVLRNRSLQKIEIPDKVALISFL